MTVIPSNEKRVLELKKAISNRSSRWRRPGVRALAFGFMPTLAGERLFRKGYQNRFPFVLLLLAALSAVGCLPSPDGEVADIGSNTGGTVADPCLLPEPTARIDRVVLLTIDTWRADHLLSEKAGVSLTPGLEGLLEHGTRFTQASSVGASTSPGIAGLFTSLMPDRSGVVRNVNMLPLKLPTLATTLRDSGFRTAAWIANPVLRVGYGFERGFEHYELFPPVEPDAKARADVLVSEVVDYVDSNGDGKYFLWLHLIDPHGPYEPVADVLELFPEEAFGTASTLPLFETNQPTPGGILQYQWRSKLYPDVQDPRSYLARYAAEVRTVDSAISGLVATLLTDSRTMLVLASDHGEALNDDHGHFFAHNLLMTQDQIHTPLAIFYPGVVPGGVCDRPVSNIDVMPTVLGLLGLTVPGPHDGVDLRLAMPADRFVVAQNVYESMVRLDEWKVRQNRESGALIFSRIQGFEEFEHERGAVPSEVVARLLDEMHRIGQLPAVASALDRSAISQQERDQLKTLGYLDFATRDDPSKDEPPGE